MSKQIIDPWKTRSDGVVLHITNPSLGNAFGDIRLRCDQTGEIYLNAHDIAGSPYTYTEVIRVIDPTDVPKWINPGNHPENGYSKGDMVSYSFRIWESYINENTFSPGYGWGWQEVWPRSQFEEKEPIYVDFVEPEDGDGE